LSKNRYPALYLTQERVQTDDHQEDQLQDSVHLGDLKVIVVLDDHKVHHVEKPSTAYPFSLGSNDATILAMCDGVFAMITPANSHDATLTLYTGSVTSYVPGSQVARSMAAGKKKQRAPLIAEARVYQALKKAILSGQYRPGCVLIQENLCREFRVSRTPVRDALTHLQAEGLVVAIPHKGVLVRQLSQKDVRDIYEVRLVLESAAAGDAASKVNKKEMSSILDRLLRLRARKEFSFESVKKVGDDLHRAILVSSGNRIMKEVLDRIESLIEMTRIPFRESYDRLEQINQEHIEIAEALLQEDPQKAAELMKNHIALTEDAHLRILMGRTRRTR
jgi:DNA-binding GntR family transcriptional regulator